MRRQRSEELIARGRLHTLGALMIWGGILTATVSIVTVQTAPRLGTAYLSQPFSPPRSEWGSKSVTAQIVCLQRDG